MRKTAVIESLPLRHIDSEEDVVRNKSATFSATFLIAFPSPIGISHIERLYDQADAAVCSAFLQVLRTLPDRSGDLACPTSNSSYPQCRALPASIVIHR